MMHGHFGFGIAAIAFHLIVAGGFLYFMYNITKACKRMADAIEKKSQ